MIIKEIVMKQTKGLFILSVLLVSYTGCNKDNCKFPVPQPDARADSYVSKSGFFKIGSDKYRADFGTITVAENRNNPASGIVHLPFIRIHSDDDTPAEPIFGLSGGPGTSNMLWDWNKARIFLTEHDFVLVGYRGVDGSVILDCPEVTSAFKGKKDMLGDAAIRTIGRAWTKSAARLSAKGIDLNGFTMAECIEDNESVRKSLKYKRINLLSESYGTRIAYLYGLKHPEALFRSVLIGVNPPGHFAWKSEEIDTQLKQYDSLWFKDPVARLKSPDLYATMRRVLHKMPRRWLFVPVNPGKVRVVTHALLFNCKTAALVFDAYVDAENGDASGLALMSLAYDHVVPGLNTWGDLASKAVSADFDASGDYCEVPDTSLLPLGSPLTRLLWCPLKLNLWPVKQLSPEFRELRYSDVETLLLSGNLDFSTPAEFATNELLPFLHRGMQVIVSDCGHVNDLWYNKMENTSLLLTSFYGTGIPDTSKNEHINMDFKVKWGFADTAKTVCILLAVAGISLTFAIWRLMKRILPGLHLRAA
jgi:pimeloyl-ACP methyl ester carboxylesterase